MPTKTAWNLDAERELWADICTPGRHPESLWWFVRVAWGAEFFIRETGELRWLTARVHRPYLTWLQNQILEWKASRRAGKVVRWQVGVIIPRGFGKTVTATKAANLWAQLDEPNMTSYIGSEIHPKAMAFLGPIKRVMSGEDPYAWFAWLYGVWYEPERLWAKDEVETAYRKAVGLSEPSFGTFGVDRGITGAHPLMCWFDDPLSKEKLKEGGQWLASVLASFDSIYPALRADSFFAFVLTRYLDNDVAGYAFESEGVMSWDGMPPVDKRHRPKKDGRWRVYFLQARDKDSKPTLPEVWSTDALDRYESRNSQDFAAQMMNDPGTGEHMPLTQDQLDNMMIDRDKLPPIEYATIHLDTAFKNEDRQGKGDYNTICTWLHDLRPNGFVYFDGAEHSNMMRGEDFNDALIRVLRDLRRRGIRVRAITDEPELGGKRGTWAQLMTQAIGGAGLRAPEIILLNRAGKNKTMRIKEAANYWVEGYARIIRGAKNVDTLIHEMLRIGVSAFDDMADASADVFHPEVWRRPHYGNGTDPNEGTMPLQPGDYKIRGSLTNDQIRALYDEHNPELAPDSRADYERTFGFEPHSPLRY